jgi:5-methylcytosine-specific restriction enzyme A
MKSAKSRIPAFDLKVAQAAPKKAASIYLSREWRALLAAIIAERGRRCEDPGCEVPGGRTGCLIYGDHIVELRDGGAALDRRNVMLRCGLCHGRKTAAERARRMTQRYEVKL